MDFISNLSIVPEMAFKKQVAFYSDKCIQCGICKGEHNDITAQSCPADALIPYGTEYEVNDLVDILMQDEAFSGTVVAVLRCQAANVLHNLILPLLLQRKLNRKT